jgi:hypothetical protein
MRAGNVFVTKLGHFPHAQEGSVLRNISSAATAYVAASTNAHGAPRPLQPAKTTSGATSAEATKIELSPAAQRLQQAREALELLTRLSRAMRGGGDDRWDQINQLLSRTFDQIIEAASDTVTLGTDGADAISGWTNIDVQAGDGDDAVSGWSGSKVDGGGGNDLVDVWSDSSVSAGDGNDMVKAWSNSQVSGGNGDDVIDAWSGSRVSGGNGNDVIKAWSDSAVNGDDGDDVIDAWSESRVSGGNGNDVIKASSDSVVNGDDGDDVISAWSNGRVTGGRGNDEISIAHDSVAVFNVGDGKDNVTTLGSGNQIQFGAGLTADQVSFSFDGDKTHITFAGNENDAIMLTRTAGNVTLSFADGTTLDVPPVPRPQSDLANSLRQQLRLDTMA